MRDQRIILSIIIPFYNSETYFDRCLNSIVTQLTQETELLLINDGSEDNSLNIVSKYLKNDSNIRIFNKKHSGVSDSRNFGLDHSLGSFIVFWDSDDVIANNSISKILEIIKNKQFDVLLFYFSHMSNKKKVETKRHCLSNINVKESLNKIYFDDRICGYVWNKCFNKKAIINWKLKFDENILVSEDELFVISCLVKAKSIMICNEVFYFYRNNDDSTMHSKDPLKTISSCRARIAVYTLLYGENKKLSRKVMKRAWENAINACYLFTKAQKNKPNFDCKNELQQQFCAFFKMHCNDYILKSPKFMLKEEIIRRSLFK
jgi:glycosyltransferase involved in cell wall biosynthesis